MRFITILLLWCTCIELNLAEITKHGLIIVDIQFDFADPAGSLSVFLNDKNEYLNISSSEYVTRINEFIEQEKDRFDFIAFSIDYHPVLHCSFASTLQSLGASVDAFEIVHPEQVDATAPWKDDICLSQTGYQQLWPDHCVFGSDGAKFMSDLYDIRPVPHLQSEEDLRRVIVWRDPALDELYVTNYKLSGSYLIHNESSFKDEIDHVMSTQATQISANVSQVMYVFKGRDHDIDSYSVFDGNDGATRTGLFDALNAYDYTPANTDLTIFGIAYDYCVVFTCRDAVDHGYHVTIMDQLTAPVFPDAVAALKTEMQNIGMSINYSYGNVDLSATATTSTVDEDEDETTVGDEDHTHDTFVAVIVALSVVVVVLLLVVVYCKHQRDKISVGFSGGNTGSTAN
mmetsp:Transcript_220/g.347  ORF Transcript_220/g.347 Transcript_220/m.347 type:complete len:400 (-) Transcript_220:139-1338(-)